jgi:hypothetical protein
MNVLTRSIRTHMCCVMCMQVSGTGLVNVYEFLTEKFPDRIDAELHAQILAAGDMKGKFIAQGASVKVRSETPTISSIHYIICNRWQPLHLCLRTVLTQSTYVL